MAIHSSRIDGSLCGGYIVFTPLNGGEVLRVPCTGFKGDYQALPVLVPTAFGFPWLAKLQNGTFYNQPNGATFTLAGGDVPYILSHFHHQSRALRTEVLDAVTGQFLGLVSPNIKYMPRNPTATASSLSSGTARSSTRDKSAPFRTGAIWSPLSIVKALVDLSKPQNIQPGDVERWVSPVITLARP